MPATQTTNELRANMWRIADECNCGNLFASRPTIAEAFAYADTVANAMTGADKVAMLTAIAVLCNSIRDDLRRNS